MGKKIVILNGSPRKTGNTAALTAAFTKGAKGAGTTVRLQLKYPKNHPLDTDSETVRSEDCCPNAKPEEENT